MREIMCLSTFYMELHDAMNGCFCISIYMFFWHCIQTKKKKKPMCIYIEGILGNYRSLK